MAPFLHGTRCMNRTLSNRAPAARAQVPEGPASAGVLRLVVDLNRCEAYAQCCFMAPSVFELHGEEALWYDPEPDTAQREHVLRAAAACPVQAIVVEHAEPAVDTGTDPDDDERGRSR